VAPIPNIETKKSESEWNTSTKPPPHCPTASVGVSPPGKRRLCHWHVRVDSRGTVRFLKQAASRCDRLFVAIVPVDASTVSADAAAQIARLLRPTRRERILSMTDGVEAAALVTPPSALAVWSDAAPQAVWFHSQSENDLPPAIREQLETRAARIETLPGDSTCTTLDVLTRLAR
jgi:hypothetical protein